MKKIFLSLILLCLTLIVFANDYNLSNKVMNLKFFVEKNQVVLNQITDNITKQNFISSITNKNLWEIYVKKDKDYNGEKILLTPSMAEYLKVVFENPKNSIKDINNTSFEVKVKNPKLVFTWTNVKTENMTSGFDVVATVELENENSYWTIEVSPNKEYGIWNVTYPRINDMEALNGDLIIYPLKGNAAPISEFNEKGFRNPTVLDPKADGAFCNDIGYFSPTFLQYLSFTKGKSTLYFSPEDISFSDKTININMLSPNHLDYVTSNYPENMGEANIGFKSPSRFNMAMVQGDWYDSAKKYRKWGIDNKAPAYKNGLIEDRNNIPDWLKYNCVWLHGHCFLDTTYDSIVKSQKFLGVPCAAHVYTWSNYEFDTHYPNWLPARDAFKDGVKYCRDNGVHIMPYTNAHIVDKALSDTYKKYGDVLLLQKENGEYYYEAWAKDLGAENYAACISSPDYYNAYKEELINIFKECNVDAIYMDQVGAASQYPCFNPKHNHKMGGGDHYVKSYNRLISEVKAEAEKIIGDKVPIATEDVAEATDYDIYLRCNDQMPYNLDYPLPNILFSGYTVNFGDYCWLKEWDDNGGMTAMNKTAASFVSGNQFGWAEGGDYEFDKHPEHAIYFKNAALARNSHLDYFNFGELVRKVNIVSEIPKVNLPFCTWAGEMSQDYPVVKTGSFNYKGETLIVFTNISNENVNVKWNSDYKALNLENKESYILREAYPNKISKNINKIEGELTIGPRETKICIVK